MSHFECHLNRRFWRLKKAVQYVQNGGGGVGTVGCFWTHTDHEHHRFLILGYFKGKFAKNEPKLCNFQNLPQTRLKIMFM